MRRNDRLRRALGLAAVCALGCGNPPPGDAPSSGPAGLTLQIATTPITLPPGSEQYVCWSATVPAGVEPVLSRADFQVPSQGLHHYGIYWSGTAAPDAPAGPYDCSEMQYGWIFFGGGGAGDSSLVFPTGTGMPLSAGSQIVFQYHLLNATAAPLAVPAGSATATFLPEGTAYTPAAPLTVASFQFEIPADTASYDVTSGCTVPFDMQHVFSIFPHMHNYGRSVTISTAATDGGPWAQLFEHGWTPGIQQIYPLATSIDAGTQLQIDCNYANSTDVPVPATQTAEGEMCLAVLYYWPAQSPAYACGF